MVLPVRAGKSTLLKLMTGDLTPSKGTVTRHPHLSIGRYHQHSVDQLDEDKTVLEFFKSTYPNGRELAGQREAGSAAASVWPPTQWFTRSWQPWHLGRNSSYGGLSAKGGGGRDPVVALHWRARTVISATVDLTISTIPAPILSHVQARGGRVARLRRALRHQRPPADHQDRHAQRGAEEPPGVRNDVGRAQGAGRLMGLRAERRCGVRHDVGRG